MGFKVIFQHILGYLMTFPVLLVKEDLRIIQTEYNYRPSASNWKLSHKVFGESGARAYDPSGERQVILRRISEP